ncbi:glycine cleavage system aminomethyltransferase GcvT [Salicibibacter cibarius]|uniref:Aminomethyltransferase n=1 Tax=Salicibibacter cibarius TaxID=2743000 RepID=A0A7T7CBE5_9BACI|nr:glycine cleavage system aminomethyltransferase GcvT [Salicibibacter cibarius]QQK75899.1 glycine cleavage system aminomethyltransferase GcvT [Salicibibacter cibarius]
MAEKRRTILYDRHVALGAKMVPFGGFEMPVQYDSIKAEHHAVREAVGLFDVSHMGEALIEGETALDTVQTILTNDASKLEVGKAQYSLMCNENGGIVDDFLVYQMAPETYMVIPNAANRETDIAWLKQHAQAGTTVTDVSDDYALLALQGPKAVEVLQSLTDEDVGAIGTFRFQADVAVDGRNAIVSRSGYTGEDGYEIYCRTEDAVAVWDALLAAGESAGIKPCGLGARDTLRFEARLPLYGQELTETISPLEAKLGFAVKVKKDADFIGKKVLAAEKEHGTARKIVGIEMLDKGIPRTGYPVFDDDGNEIGHVTSGTQSPTLGKNLGLAIVNTDYASNDTEIIVGVRKRKLKAKVVPTPFYSR